MFGDFRMGISFTWSSCPKPASISSPRSSLREPQAADLDPIPVTPDFVEEAAAAEARPRRITSPSVPLHPHRRILLAAFYVMLTFSSLVSPACHCLFLPQNYSRRSPPDLTAGQYFRRPVSITLRSRVSSSDPLPSRSLSVVVPSRCRRRSSPPPAVVAPPLPLSSGRPSVPV